MQQYCDVIMGAMASRITSLTIVYSTVHSSAVKKNTKVSASLAFVWGIHRSPVISPHKGPATRKMFPFGDVIMQDGSQCLRNTRILLANQSWGTGSFQYKVHFPYYVGFPLNNNGRNCVGTLGMAERHPYFKTTPRFISLLTKLWSTLLWYQ